MKIPRSTVHTRFQKARWMKIKHHGSPSVKKFKNSKLASVTYWSCMQNMSGITEKNCFQSSRCHKIANLRCQRAIIRSPYTSRRISLHTLFIFASQSASTHFPTTQQPHLFAMQMFDHHHHLFPVPVPRHLPLHITHPRRPLPSFLFSSPLIQIYRLHTALSTHLMLLCRAVTVYQFSQGKNRWTEDCLF